MTPARKTFVWLFGVACSLGLALGVVNVIAPDAVSVSWNDQNVEGFDGIWVGLFSGAIPGLDLRTDRSGRRRPVRPRQEILKGILTSQWSFFSTPSMSRRAILKRHIGRTTKSSASRTGSG